MKPVYILLRFSLFIIIGILFASCKLQSLVSDSQFSQQSNLLENINGTYILNQEVNDSIYYGHVRNVFFISDLIDRKEKELLKDKSFERLTILYNGKEKVIFNLFDGKKNLEFIYKCKPKDNYLEIYFTKKRIWALPLFMNYEYDRLRLGLDEEQNLIIHKWHTILATLTIMPFDFFGGSDYSHTLLRVDEKSETSNP